jgi:hypothetical protein
MGQPGIPWSLTKWANAAQLAADTAPPADPNGDRVARLPETNGGAPTIRLYAYDGTTVTGTPYVWDDGASLWLALGAGVAATPTVPGNISVPRLDNSKVFVAWSANTGVTRAGWLYSA